jgi:hypothetical protein
VFLDLTTQHPFVPVIIITGMPNQYGTALAAGAGALFEKPVEAPALLKTMEELLAEPSDVRLRRLCGHLDDTRYEPPARAAWGRSQPENSVVAEPGFIPRQRSNQN